MNKIFANLPAIGSNQFARATFGRRANLFESLSAMKKYLIS